MMRISKSPIATRVGPLLLAATAIGGFLSACSKDTPKSETSPAPSVSASAAASPPPSGPVVAIPLPSASVAAAVNPANLPVYDGPTGSVEGTIYVDGDPSPDEPPSDLNACPEAEAMYKKRFREGAPSANAPKGARPVADAIVGATGYETFVPERQEAVRLTFDHCSFGTRTLAMTFGQRIEVVNKTSKPIAPALEPMSPAALMVAPPDGHGDPVKIYPEKPGYFTITDKIGPKHRTLDVYVLQFPTHAVSDVAGHYRIDGIPVGPTTVFARLRAIGQEASAKVNVLAGVVQKVDLTLHHRAPPDAGTPDAGPRPRIIP